jgi:SAM-dependent methyltransferase
MLKLNFGCGTNRLAGWDNFDSEIDIARPLPFVNASAEFILAEHVVEHVPYGEALLFFRECRRVLKAGGVLRVAVPSVEQVWQRGDQAYFDFVRRWMPPAFDNDDRRGAMHAIIVLRHGHRGRRGRGSLLGASLFFAGFDDDRCRATPACPIRSRPSSARRHETPGRAVICPVSTP